MRRRWPATLVSWSRLLAGGLRDPLVGRDVLAGCLIGAVLRSLLQDSGGLSLPGSAILRHNPYLVQRGCCLARAPSISNQSFTLSPCFLSRLRLLFILFLFRVLLRKQWAAAVGIRSFIHVLLRRGDPVFLLTSLIF